MTLDTALLNRPTDSLVLSKKPRFFPFKIPNFHQQLRHYISTADPDRIYLIAKDAICLIYISSQKWERLAKIPFEPKCLAAGYGWVGVGGSDQGECAFIRIDGHDTHPHGTDPSHESEVNHILPVDLESDVRIHPSWLSSEETRRPTASGRRQPSEVQLLKFGGSIVNSVTIHRLPGDGHLSHEDVALLSNNDRTVTIYSLTRSKTLQVIHHPACMNYAIISPDSNVLAAVGDENHVYFYEMIRDRNNTVTLNDRGDKVAEWTATRLCCRELQTRTDNYDDGSCFTVAFSPSSHLCAVGSQSGIITIFDVPTIRESKDEGQDNDPVLCLFLSSRSHSEGAVRCMSFSPDPWDLLVWIEDTGRVGVADIRQAFCRRQILTLDLNESCFQPVTIEEISLQTGLAEPSSDVEGYNLLEPSRPVRLTDDIDTDQHAVPSFLDGPPLNSSNSARADSPLREPPSQHSPEGDRQIIEFLRARFTQRLEEGRDEGVSRWTFQVQSGSNLRAPSSIDGPNRSSRTVSPFRYDNDVLQDILRENYLSRTGSADRHSNPRRQSSVVLSQVLPGPSNQTSEIGNSTTEMQPIITLRLATSPSSSPSRAANAGVSSNNAEQMNVDTRSRGTLSRSSALLDTSSPPIDVAISRTRQRSQRSSSIPRRPDRPVSVVEGRHEVQRAANPERHRRQRLMANEIRSPRRIRNNVNDLPDRDLGQPLRTQDPGGTAGVGWGPDGRTLFIGTVEGIFEYQLNIQDRRTFPTFIYR